MVYLVWDKKGTENRAAYASLEDAQRQGDYDNTVGKPVLRIEDADGKVLTTTFSKVGLDGTGRPKGE